jgi:hypothetical protein
MLALLRKASVADDPVPHRPVPLERRQDLLFYDAQQRRVAPVRLGHHMVQRLMPRPDTSRLDPRGHRLDALAGTGQQQPRAVGTRRRRPAGVTQHRRDRIQIGCEARLAISKTRKPFYLSCHAPHRGRPTPIDTVRLGAHPGNRISG